MTHSSSLIAHRSCSYCGLDFSGPGYSSGDKRHYCCYGCYLVERIVGSRGEEGIAAWLIVRLGVGAFLAMNVMMISLVLYTNSAEQLGQTVVQGLRWAMLILSTPAVVILGAPFGLSATRDLLKRRISTDALIATGSLAAYAVSAYHVLTGGQVYFDTATMLLLIVTLGKLLEASAKHRTSQAIREMIELTPSVARVLRDGEEVEIPSGEVLGGDRTVVRPGERIPADGEMVSGECLIEEAAFTGESRPRSCSPGDKVFGGSLNCDGLIEVRAERVGSQSLLAQIQSFVRRAQRERAPVERLAERVATVFTPVVWLAALATAAYWGIGRHDYERAGLTSLAVLVVACPCALGLATPMAVCIALGRAAREGVMIRSGEVLERLPRVKRMFLDKTGTLTENRLAVVQVRTIPGVSQETALIWAASLEAGSEHSIARAIVAEASQIGTISDFRTFPGRGVAGTVTISGETKKVTVGSLKLLLEDHSISDAVQHVDDAMTATYVGWDGRIAAAILLSDQVRADARDFVSAIKSAGITPAVISGDLEAPTRRLAEKLAIGDVFFECRPSEKVAAIHSARSKTVGSVAMVGDGINDAPALAEADVGIAVGSGTDLARQASDLTLIGEDSMRIPWALELSRRTYRIIKQNLWWAFGYNSAAVILAFLGFVHPLIAAGAMTLSSLAVISNSLRLLRP